MYIFQHAKATGLVTSDVATILEILDQMTWLNGIDFSEVGMFLDYWDIKTPIQNAIPVGSIEFCEKILGKPIKAINLPEPLRELSIAGRMTGAFSMEETKRLLHEKEQLFLKSNSKVKSYFTGIYKNGDKLPNESSFFVSEVVNFQTEWRVFVHQGQILDIRRYTGSCFTNLDNAFFHAIRKMTALIDMPAFTLDVGLSEDGRILPIEVHNCIACGLYGFENKRILSMLKDAIQYEKG